MVVRRPVNFAEARTNPWVDRPFTPQALSKAHGKNTGDSYDPVRIRTSSPSTDQEAEARKDASSTFE
jgi:hypothetical protein